MTNTCTMDRIDPQIAWMAFERRDRTSDGQFVGAVVTTGIYCKPSCPARRPKRENVLFFPDGAAARAAGYRACLRCKPDEVARDRVAVRSEEHTSELQSLMRISYAVFCLKKKIHQSHCIFHIIHIIIELIHIIPFAQIITAQN